MQRQRVTMSAYRINSGDLPTRESRLHRFKQRSTSVIPIDEYVDSMGNSKYDAEVIETLFNIQGTQCAVCLETVENPTITTCKHIFCKKCIYQSLKHRKECPCCRKEINPESLILLGKANSDSYKITEGKASLMGFVIACENGNLAVVQDYINSGKVKDVNMKGVRSNGWKGYTGLMMAARYERLNVVKYLLSLPHINVSITDDTVGWNALHCACYNNKHSLELLKLLLDHSTCNERVINKTDNVGRTPLDKAQYNNKGELKNEIIDLMRKRGAKSQSELEEGATLQYFKTHNSNYILHVK